MDPIQRLMELHRSLTADFNVQPDRRMQAPIKERLKLVERKLDALRDGSCVHGLCRGCGRTIPSRRLELVPEAMDCTECATERVAA